MRKTHSSSNPPAGPAKRRQRAASTRLDDAVVDRLVAEAEAGIPAEKLRRRGRPSIGAEAASTFSVRLPDDLVTLVDARSELEGVTRGETIRRALVRYLTN
jgi:predicted transcriptional regulator